MKEDSRQSACRLCGSEIALRRWGGGECESCGSVSTTTLPTSEELGDFYRKFNDTYDGGGHSAGRNLRRYALQYLRMVRRYTKTGTLIDIGSSTNPFPTLAANSGFAVTALDYTRPKGLSEHVTFIEGNIDDEDLISQHKNAFDVVTAWAVLEHLPRPQVSVRILASICRPGGMLFLSTPEIGTALTNYSIGRSGWFCPPEHLNLLSPQAISQTFEAHGCTLLKWGRLELTPTRFLARYGIGLVEASIGALIKVILPKTWRKLRDLRVQQFKGITYFILRRN